MLSRYLDFPSMNLPMSGNRYTIHADGKVFDNNLNMQIEPFERNGELHVRLDWLEQYRAWKLGVVVALAFKRTRLPFRYWEQLDTHHLISGSCHIKDLVWKYPTDGLRYVNNCDYAFVPGFSQYIINESGELINWTLNCKMSPYVDKHGYLMYGVTPDIGNRTIVGMHRLLGLAFKEYPANVDRLDINHLDGIKNHNWLSNLEWATRTRNNLHAVEVGLRTQNKSVLVKDLVNDTVMNFFSIEECSRQLGVDGETVRFRLHAEDQPVYPPGYQFKFADDESEWRKVIDIKGELNRPGFAKPLGVRFSDGREETFPNASEAAKVLGIPRRTLAYRLKHGYYEKPRSIHVWYID